MLITSLLAHLILPSLDAWVLSCSGDARFDSFPCFDGSCFASPHHSDARLIPSLVAWLIGCSVLVAPLLPGYFCLLRCCLLAHLDSCLLQSSLEPFAFLFGAHCFHSTDC
jgi:hypothetical protein